MDVLRWSDMCYPVIPEYPVDVGCGEFLGTKILYYIRVSYPNIIVCRLHNIYI